MKTQMKKLHVTGAVIAGLSLAAMSPAYAQLDPEKDTAVDDTEQTVTNPEIIQTDEQPGDEVQTTITTGTEPTPVQTITVYEEATSTNPTAWRDKFNALIVNAPEDEQFDQLWEEQFGEIEAEEGSLEQYDLLTVMLRDEGQSMMNREEISQEAADQIRTMYFRENPGTFQVILLDKSGSVLIRETSPVDLAVAFAALDELANRSEGDTPDMGEPEASPTPVESAGEAASEVGVEDTADEPTQFDTEGSGRIE
jgi:hypothetical protein